MRARACFAFEISCCEGLMPIPFTQPSIVVVYAFLVPKRPWSLATASTAATVSLGVIGLKVAIAYTQNAVEGQLDIR